MLRKICIFITLGLIINSVSAQDTGTKEHPWDLDFWRSTYLYNSRPTVELSYGQSHITLKNSALDFNDAGLLELKLGYTYLSKSSYCKKITRLENNYLFGSYISSKINTKNSTAEDKTWRFGIGNSNGYDYLLGKKSSLVLYNANSITWTRYDEGMNLGKVGNEIDDNRIAWLSDFNQTFRFGTNTEAGVIIPLAGFVNLQAQFDRTLVFPRHLFWKHLGSVMIEVIGQGAIDGFIHAIMKSSPIAGPVMNFLLKNALSYGIYELRREKMNWPFESKEPLLFDSFKAGFTFTF
jgi:hypothetical protein